MSSSEMFLRDTRAYRESHGIAVPLRSRARRAVAAMVRVAVKVAWVMALAITMHLILGSTAWAQAPTIDLEDSVNGAGVSQKIVDGFGMIMQTVGLAAVAGLVVYVIRRSGGLFKAVSRIFGA